MECISREEYYGKLQEIDGAGRPSMTSRAAHKNQHQVGDAPSKTSSGPNCEMENDHRLPQRHCQQYRRRLEYCRCLSARPTSGHLADPQDVEDAET